MKEAAYKLIDRVDRVFTRLNNHLEGKDYVVGDRRTIVDPYAFAMICWGNSIPNKPLSDYASVFASTNSSNRMIPYNEQWFSKELVASLGCA
ncbi:glutathione binding-like protein [Leptothermofonsia sp. ETS-13]|uniref:glutathione binding-like protein n=1 Tax=Leptothermofonsia sp. ETS-13 TaxID=3035696 RepID=UPI003BA0C1D0